MTPRAPRSRPLAALAGFLVAAGIWAGCRPPDGDPAAGADSSAATAVRATGPEGAGEPVVPGARTRTGGAEAPRTGLENFPVPDDPGLAAVSETVAVVIENAGGATVVVSARAGAESVPLDTLGAGRRLRVDLVGPPGTIEIQWRLRDGEREGTVPIPAAADSTVLVTVGRDGGP